MLSTIHMSLIPINFLHSKVTGGILFILFFFVYETKFMKENFLLFCHSLCARQILLDTWVGGSLIIINLNVFFLGFSPFFNLKVIFFFKLVCKDGDTLFDSWFYSAILLTLFFFFPSDIHSVYSSFIVTINHNTGTFIFLLFFLCVLNCSV